MQRSILRSLATVSGLTVLSRVFGFVRQILIAGVIGAGGNPIADAFWAAFRLPNMFRRLFAEGAFQAAFVPLFQGRLLNDEAGAAKRFAEEVLSALLLVLFVLTALVWIAAPVFVLIVAGGFAQDPEKFDLTAYYLRIMFPYLACMSVVGLLSGILNSLDRFIAFSAAPLLLNVCQIAAILLYADHELTVTGTALAAATALSGVLQMALLYWGASRQGYRLVPRLPKLTPGVKRLLLLGAPGFISAAAVQINIIVGTNIASQQPGAVSWLMNADQLYQLPLAVIGIALGTVLLPTLSRHVKASDETAARETLNRAVELSSALCLPAAAAFLVIATPICEALFRGLAGDALSLFGGRGSAFSERDAQMTGAALALYGLGLPAFVWQKVFLPAFFAREDTRTPMRFALWAIGANTVLALSLFPLMGFLGVALATSLAAWLQTGLLIVMSARRGHFTPDGRLVSRFPRILLACAGLGALLWWASARLPFVAGYLFGREWLALIALAVAGVLVYALVLILIGGVRLRDYRSVSSTGK